jgi:hypothetical protein
MLSRKHYAAIAKLANRSLTAPFTSERDKQILSTFFRELADEVLLPDNPRFDRERFLRACVGNAVTR